MITAKMENNCNYSDNWQPYIGDYDKFEYDIKLKDGTVVENCYPNGGKFNSISDLHDNKSFDEIEVAEIRFSANPRFGINGNVSSIPQFEYLDRVYKPFILDNPNLPELKYHYNGKRFVCKGKHQYRLSDTVKEEMGNGTVVREIWKCQCGKVLGT